MRDGFIRAIAFSPALQVADCQYNAQQIVQCMKQAAEQDVQLCVFPELCITGYTCGDLFFQSTLQKDAVSALLSIAAQSAGLGLVAVVGLPLVEHGKLYDCAAVVFEGKVLGVVPKRYLPDYDEFYEKRYFEPAPKENGAVLLEGIETPFGTGLLFECSEFPAFCIGVEICEDLWAQTPPSAALSMAGALIIANPSASDEIAGKADYRRTLVLGQSARLLCGYVYADAGRDESTTDLVFAGHNMVAENGVMLHESKPFAGGVAMSEFDLGKLAAERRRITTFRQIPPAELGMQVVRFRLPLHSLHLSRAISPTPFVPGTAQDRTQRCEELFAIQAAGLAKRLRHVGSKTAVIGVSGGLDSCLALLVAVRAMDQLGRSRTDVQAVTMPCFGTTDRTKSNAQTLCEHLGVGFQTVDIGPAVRQHFIDIGQAEDRYDVTYENAQARERTQVLMDLANQTGGMVVGTGDLSELALGWATYNGDHMSHYGVNASIPKTLVRHMVKYVADTEENAALSAVLYDILSTPVSPELFSAQNGEIAQKTEDLVGPYELHDFVLFYAVRYGFGPGKIFRLARTAFRGTYPDDVILHWMQVFYRRFFQQQFKRSCLPDGPKVGSVCLSPRSNFHMPSDASAAAWLRQVDQLIDRFC